MAIKLLTIGHSYVVALNRRLAHEMQRVGGSRYDVTVASPEYYKAKNDLREIAFEPIENECVKCELLRSHLNSRIHVFFYERKKLKSLCAAADFVHCWEEPYIVSGAQVCSAVPNSTPVVFFTLQNIQKRYPPPFCWFEKYCLRKATGWISCGETIEQARLACGYGKLPHRQIPLGVALETFFPAPAARLAKRLELNWPENGPAVVGYLGRFVEEKGIRLLLRVLEKLAVPWRALFVGGGPLEGELREWAARFPESVRIVTGVVHDQVPGWINAMDVLCAPSQTRSNWIEQLGRMLIEAFACGVPVIGSDSGEIPFVIGDAGIVAGENDEAAWVRAISELIESPKLRERLSRLGLERAQSCFAWPVVARKHLEFFDSLI